MRRTETEVIYRERFSDASYENAFFLMGDNRCGSLDSRYHGAVPFEAIVGRKL